MEFLAGQFDDEAATSEAQTHGYMYWKSLKYFFLCLIIESLEVYISYLGTSMVNVNLFAYKKLI